MSKLYDLMVMAFKYQCLVCGHPSRVNGEITSLHVSNLKAILSSRGSAQANAAHTTLDKTTVAVSDGVAGDGSSIETEAGRERAVEASLSAACSESGGGTVENLIEAVARTILAVYNDLPLGELWSLYSNLLSFFQDRRVKVSALLVSNLQGEHGDMVLHPPLLGPSPRGQPSPGYYRRFDASGKVLAVHGVGSSGFPALASLHGTTSTPTTIPQRGAPLPNREDWRTLGRNIYCDKADDSMNFPSSLSPGPAQGPVSPKKEGAGRDAAASATAGLNFLSSMLGAGGNVGSDDFSLDLEHLGRWEEEKTGEKMEGLGGGGGMKFHAAATTANQPQLPSAKEKSGNPNPVLQFKAVGSSTRHLKTSLDKELGGEDEGSHVGGGGGGDSILDMMDSLG